MINSEYKSRGNGQCGGELELYLHIPFCVRKCKYCDFLSFPSDVETIHRYVEAMCEEIRENSKCAKQMTVRSVFVGGGTPSLLAVEDMALLMDTVRECFTVEENAEISMEANPGTLTEEKLKGYKRAGINRLSIGLQSAQQEELKALGRIHSFDTFLECYQMAIEQGFENINVDVMSALPGQDKDKLKDTLEKLLNLNPPPTHFSVYSLILEEETVLFSEYEQGKFSLPSEEEDRDMYEMTRQILYEQGYFQYEISNYAKPGFECIHNCGYWERVPYLGFGLGAASLFEEKRYQNSTDLKAYLENPCKGRRLTEELDVRSRMEEMMFLGLRMTKGVSEHDFYQRFGSKMDEIYGDVIEKNVRDGLLVKEDGRVFLTAKGMDLSNYVMAQFL